MFQRKTLLAGLTVAALVCVVQSASATVPVDPIETITVPAAGAQVVTSNTVLEDGVPYFVLAEGTYTHDGTNYCDAEWWWEHWQGRWLEAYGDPEEQPPYRYDLNINGEPIDWMGCALPDPDPVADFLSYEEDVYSGIDPNSPDRSGHHTYWTMIIGNGETVDFQIWDYPAGNNSGSLTATIYTPEPASLMLLSLAGLLIRRR